MAGTGTGRLHASDLAGDEEDDPVHEPLTGHKGAINALDVAVVGGRPLAVTGGEDGTVRIWDLVTGRPAGPPLPGHQGRVEAVRAGTLHGRPVALTAGRDACAQLPDYRRSPV